MTMFGFVKGVVMVELKLKFDTKLMWMGIMQCAWNAKT
jgi:hypothetical protein